jgi:predicted MFS family arabinose efflux permease
VQLHWGRLATSLGIGLSGKREQPRRYFRFPRGMHPCPRSAAALVPDHRLESANARLLAANTLANEFIGPPLGSVLFAVAVALPFAIDSATLAIAAAILLSLRGTFRADVGVEEEHASLWRQIGEGLRWLRRHRLLRGVAIATLIWASVDAAWFSIFVLYVLRALRGNEAAFGLLLAAGGVGALLGSAITPQLVAWRGRLPTLFGSLVMAAVAQAGLALTSSLGTAAGLLGLSSASFVAWNVVSLSMRQALVPDRLLGRVSSAFRMAGVGGEALGAVLGGVLAAAYGVRAPLVVGVPVLLALALVSARTLTAPSAA